MVYTTFWLISKHLFTLVEVKKSWINLQLRVEHFIYNNDASPCFFPCFHHKPVNVGHTSDRKVHTENITKNIGINNTVSRYVFLLFDWCYFNTLNFRRRCRKFMRIYYLFIITFWQDYWTDIAIYKIVFYRFAIYIW